MSTEETTPTNVTTSMEAPEVVSNYSVRLPPFWPDDIELWFARVEAQFRRSRINSDLAKFDHVVEGLDDRVAREVRNIICNPPVSEKYATMKRTIMQHLVESESRRIHKLLHNEMLGDRKPSQFHVTCALKPALQCQMPSCGPSGWDVSPSMCNPWWRGKTQGSPSINWPT